MNLISKSVTKVLSSSLYHSRAAKLPTRKWVISRQMTSGGGTEAPEKESAPPKNTEYQQELSNAVSLIGLVDEPVKLDSSSDGKFWAGTVISRQSESNDSSFWVPIRFEGDLAKTAAQHLKKDDRIHISGKLFQNETFAKPNFQVMVETLNFVQDVSPAAKTISPPEIEETTTEKNSPDMTISPPEIEETITEKKPSKWEKVQVTDEDWKHLLENPKEWVDHRGNKANGLVNPKYPDFKRKTDGLSLWLNKVPEWVLPGLQGLEFGVIVPAVKPKQVNEELWNDLAENPHKWWDNRCNKRNPRAPDFKHKETGEGLWMSGSPTWVQSKLPPPLKKDDKRAMN